MKIFAGAFGLVWLAGIIAVFVAWIQGIVMAFSASVLLGIICIFIEVPFPVFAIAHCPGIARNLSLSAN